MAYPELLWIAALFKSPWENRAKDKQHHPGSRHKPQAPQEFGAQSCPKEVECLVPKLSVCGITNSHLIIRCVNH